MTVADQAREAAIHCEMKKCGLRQSKDGIIVSFVLHPHEVPKGLQTADIGSRWMVALVQIGDDETPLKLPPAEKETSSTTPATPQLAAPDKSQPVGAKREWRDIPPAAQASMLCDKAVFQAFLREKYSDEWIESMADPDECVRLICAVSSKSELNDGPQRVIWHQLQNQYSAWQALAE